MNKYNFIISLFFLFGFSNFEIKAQVYEFPIKPGDKEWKKFKTHNEMDKVTQIPQSTLTKMNTKDLLLSCLNYPLFDDIFAYNNWKTGLKIVQNRFNGLQEFFQRKDMDKEILSYYKDLEESKNNIFRTIDTEVQFIHDLLKVEVLLLKDSIFFNFDKNILNQLAEELQVINKFLLSNKESLGTTNFDLNSKILNKIYSLTNTAILKNKNIEQNVKPKVLYNDQPVQIPTPRGTMVNDVYLRDPFDNNGEISHWAKMYLNWVDTQYFRCITMSDFGDRTYNCHGYAYYKYEGLGTYWIGLNEAYYPYEEDAFWIDGSYNEVEDEVDAEKITYPGDHTAVYYPYELGDGYYLSKWNAARLFLHRPSYCPFGDPDKFLARAHDVGIEESSLSAALANCKNSQTVNIASNYYLDCNISTTGKRKVKTKPGVVLYLNGYFIKGKIINEGTIWPSNIRIFNSSDETVGYYSTIEQALQNVASGERIYVYASTYYINSNLVIPAGTTLFLSPETVLVNNNNSIIVYGTLSAQGGYYGGRVIFTSSSGWGGLQIYSNNVTLSYCKIENASCGMYIENASPSISSTWINGCGTAVSVYGGGAAFDNCTFALNSGTGIYASNSANVSICYYKNNVITRNNTNLDAGYGSTIYASYGQNTFDIVNGGAYKASAGSWGSSIPAVYNYWGQPPPGSNWAYGNVDYSNYLSTDPNSGRSLSKQSSNENAGIFKNNDQIQSNNDLDNLYLLWNKKDYKSVYENCKSLISKDNSKPQIYSVISLMRLAAQFIECDIENELGMITSQNPKDDIGGFALLNYAYYLGNKNRYDENLIKLDELIDKYKNTELEKMGLFYKIIVLYNHKNDKVDGENAFTQFENKYKNDKLFDELKKIIKKDSKDKPNLTVKNETEDLVNIYPNPFNPTTTISYSIPKEGQVKLVVFDILGKEVKTLVNEVKSAGSYSVQFDANKLSSGTYYCRIIITPSNGDKSIVQQKQMQVLK